MDLHREWPTLERQQLLSDMIVLEDFISADEEAAICAEVDPYMQRLRYEFDHWDDVSGMLACLLGLGSISGVKFINIDSAFQAIHGFRETERKHWYPDNKAVLERVAQTAFNGEIMPYIHVLDLAEGGLIKAHVDSSRVRKNGPNAHRNICMSYL